MALDRDGGHAMVRTMFFPATASANPAGPAGRATTGRAMPYTLRTHCGIDEARIGATYYEAKTPLSDGSGNPPNGWGIPSRRAP